jgi:hypothetical protein
MERNKESHIGAKRETDRDRERKKKKKRWREIEKLR